MDGMLSLFETVTYSSRHDALLQTFLKTCSEHQAFLNKDPAVIQPVLANINSKLNSSATRYDGLILLKTFLPQCSVEIFGENMVSWMQQCLKGVEGEHNKHALASTSYQVLKILLQKSEQMPEMKRIVCGFVVTKIIDNFQQTVPHEASLSMLECLEVLMCNYGPSCGQQKNVLEKCVLQYIDSSDVNVIKRVARCVAFLPLLGGGGSLGTNHVSRWKQEQQKMCATLHHILDELFDNVREIPNSRSSMTSGQVLSLPPTSETVPLLRVYQLMTRFINVSKFLQAMLISEFPVEKTVLPDEILEVVCRGLAVTSHTMGKKVSTDLLMVGAMLPQIHVTLLKVLDSLIICCGRNLLPYAPVVCKLVLQTLKWTSAEKWVYGIEKPYGQLRIAAYNTLTLWLQTSDCGSCVEFISEQLVSVLMQDVWFEKEAVTLNVQNTSSKKKQKCKQNTSEQQGVGNSRKYIPDPKANSKTCRAALCVLQWMLHSAATFIKPTIHRLLQETTVGLLFDVQRSSQIQDFPVPYGETSCRLELYRLLHTLVLEPHATWPPPTQFALHMLSVGRSDPDLKVSSLCTTALITVEKLVHPASGTMHFPVSIEEMLESTKGYKQEFLTKAEESSIFMEISEEEGVKNYVQNRGLKGSEQATSHTNHATTASEEVVIVYENKMDVEDNETCDSENNEYEDEESSESEIISVVSEASDICVKTEVCQSYELSEVLSKTRDIQEVSLVDVSESDGEFQNEQAGSASSACVRCKNDNSSNGGEHEESITKHRNSRTDSKTYSSPVHCNKEPASSKTVGTSEDLVNEDKLIPNQQQKKTAESSAGTSNRCENIIQASNEKGRKDIARSSGKKSLLVTENEEERENDLVLQIVQEDDDNEPNPKKIKLDSPECLKPYAETPKTDSHSKVGDGTAVPRTGKDKEEQPVNGVVLDPEDITEEEMLQTFVDVLPG